MKIGDVVVGEGKPLVLIAGLNVVEGEIDTLQCAQAMLAIAERHDVPLVFKASVDKANRSRHDAFRGPGFDRGLRILEAVKSETGLPLLTDVHEPSQAEPASQVVDCLQIPAFLCRQTDLLAACAATGVAVNVKKGQFVAPEDIRFAVEKLNVFGARDVLVTDRGVCFGYHNLVADMRGLVQIREFAPVCFDATHAVQFPGIDRGGSSGDRRFVAPLARAAVATGIDALFVEAHPEPDRAPCDGACQIEFAELEGLVAEVRAIERALAVLRGGDRSS